MSIEQLFATADMNLVAQQTQATFPFLRELADFIANGGKLTQPPYM